MSGTREGTYGSEFHRGLLATYKNDICGTKTHGSMLQKRGQPDYVYYARSKTFGAGYIGIEFKFIPFERVPKTCYIVLEKLLRPDQRFILHDINAKGQLGIQATVIEIQKRTYITIFHTVSMQEINKFMPSEFAALMVNDPADVYFLSSLFIMRRSPGKGLLLYRYDEFNRWLRGLMLRRP